MYRLTKKEREMRAQLRGRYAAGLRWYALTVHWGRERVVQDRIADLSDPEEPIEVLLPERRCVNGSGRHGDLLFSGYVFLHCAMNDELYMQLAGDPEVFEILGRGYRIPSAIPDEEMECLRGVLETAARARLVTRHHVGRRALVVKGLLKGARGRIVECNASEVKLEIGFSFLGGENAIEVSLPHGQVEVEQKSISALLDGSSGRSRSVALRRTI